MQFNLSYNEVVQLILEKTGKELPISYGGPHTLRISYKVPLMGAVGLDVNVDRINGSDIFLSYGGGAGIEFMVRTALGKFKKQQGGDLLDILDGNREIESPHEHTLRAERFLPVASSTLVANLTRSFIV